ncbi:MAG TPA: MASE1 domain-containing protein [Verrucomicrobiae bacterium]|jgi:PAS domain S-box-containing protein
MDTLVKTGPTGNRTPSRLLAVPFVALFYFGGGMLGLSLRDSFQGGYAIWPPAGLALAALVLWGTRLWPGVFVGAFLLSLFNNSVHATTGLLVAKSLGIAAANTLEAIVCASLVQRLARGERGFKRVSDVMGFAAATVIGCAVGATAAVGILAMTTFVAWQNIMLAWSTLWAGHLACDCTLAALLLTWVARPWRRLDQRQWLEAGALALAVVIGAPVIFWGWPFPSSADLPLVFLTIPLLLWAAVRFTARAVMLVVTVLSAVATTATVDGTGPFALPSLFASLLSLQAFICIVSVTALALAAAISERDTAKATLSQKEKILADIAEGAPVGLVRLRADGVIQWANPAEMELLGYAQDDYVGRNAADFYENPTEGQEVLERLTRGDTLRDYETRLRARDGSLRIVLINSSASYREDGSLLHARLFTHNITGRRRTEEENHRLNLELEKRVQQRTAQLEAANKELEAFSYSVSHDLRAPLRALRGFTEALLELHSSQLDVRGQEFLRRAAAASCQMDRLIEDLLKLSQVSRGDLQFQEVNLSSLANDIAVELAASEPSRHVEFVIAPDCAADGDPRLVRVALDNLMRNAWKFSGKRADARIEFGLTEEPEPAFFVRDNGAGFDMAFSKRLFGVFQRLHATSEFPGTGIGLATVQRIIHRHGGRSWAEGAVNRGATFYFTLPGARQSADLKLCA